MLHKALPMRVPVEKTENEVGRRHVRVGASAAPGSDPPLSVHRVTDRAASPTAVVAPRQWSHLRHVRVVATDASPFFSMKFAHSHTALTSFTVSSCSPTRYSSPSKASLAHRSYSHYQYHAQHLLHDRLPTSRPLASTWAYAPLCASLRHRPQSARACRVFHAVRAQKAPAARLYCAGSWPAFLRISAWRVPLTARFLAASAALVATRSSWKIASASSCGAPHN